MNHNNEAESCLIFIQVNNSLSFDGKLYSPVLGKMGRHFSSLKGALKIIQEIHCTHINMPPDNWFSFWGANNSYIYLLRIFVQHDQWMGEIYDRCRNINYPFSSIEELSCILSGKAAFLKSPPVSMVNLTFWETLSCFSGCDTLSFLEENQETAADLLSVEDWRSIVESYKGKQV